MVARPEYERRFDITGPNFGRPRVLLRWWSSSSKADCNGDTAIAMCSSDLALLCEVIGRSLCICLACEHLFSLLTTVKQIHCAVEFSCVRWWCYGAVRFVVDVEVEVVVRWLDACNIGVVLCGDAIVAQAVCCGVD
ncbi:Hypothetical predicted protein [Olea europaea subsp. europaea]|uniref:Uncharacterized protein n=1 Tax=Olea europaea subsp. europaea TaxID=158383 RepID=A0A8S0P8J7_OLEEU|nr:Hypothetical predicted protein [Olea europaea subsp. europaea]